MGKEIKLDSTEPEFDDDFNFDFDQINSTPPPPPKGREAVKAGATAAFKGVQNAVSDPSNLERFIREALPEQYGSAYDFYNENDNKIRDVWKSVVAEIRPVKEQIKTLTKKFVPNVKDLLPEGLVEKLVNFSETDAEAWDAHTGNIVDPVQNTLTEIFKQQTSNQAQLEDRDDKQRTLDRGFEHLRHKSITKFLHGIWENTTRVAEYQDNILMNYQRKSLEIQLQQYGVIGDQYALSKQLSVSLVDKLDKIIHNTALPDYKKMLLTESAGESLRSKFITDARNAFFGDSTSFITEFFANAGKKARGTAKSITDGVKMGASLAGNDFEDPFAEEEDAVTKYSKKVGKFVGEVGLNKASKLVNKVMGRNQHVRGVGEELGYRVKNAGDEVKDWLTNPKAETVYDDIRHVVADYGNAKNIGTQKDTTFKTEGIADLDKGKGYTGADSKSLTTVIPGFLSLILKEIQSIRTGQEAPLTKYDHDDNKFVSASKLKKNIVHRLMGNNRDRVNNVFDDLLKSVDLGNRLNTKTRGKVKKALFKHIQAGGNTSIEKLLDPKVWKDLDEKEAKRVMYVLNKYIRTDKAGRRYMGKQNVKRQNRVTGTLNGIKKTFDNPAGRMQELINIGNHEELAESGLISKDNKLNRQKISEIMGMTDDEYFAEYGFETKVREKKKEKEKTAAERLADRAAKKYKQTKETVNDMASNAMDQVRDENSETRTTIDNILIAVGLKDAGKHITELKESAIRGFHKAAEKVRSRPEIISIVSKAEQAIDSAKSIKQVQQLTEIINNKIEKAANFKDSFGLASLHELAEEADTDDTPTQEVTDPHSLYREETPEPQIPTNIPTTGNTRDDVLRDVKQPRGPDDLTEDEIKNGISINDPDFDRKLSRLQEFVKNKAIERDKADKAAVEEADRKQVVNDSNGLYRQQQENVRQFQEIHQELISTQGKQLSYQQQLLAQQDTLQQNTTLLNTLIERQHEIQKQLIDRLQSTETRQPQSNLYRPPEPSSQYVQYEPTALNNPTRGNHYNPLPPQQQQRSIHPELYQQQVGQQQQQKLNTTSNVNNAESTSGLSTLVGETNTSLSSIREALGDRLLQEKTMVDLYERESPEIVQLKNITELLTNIEKKVSEGLELQIKRIHEASEKVVETKDSFKDRVKTAFSDIAEKVKNRLPKKKEATDEPEENKKSKLSNLKENVSKLAEKAKETFKEEYNKRKKPKEVTEEAEAVPPKETTVLGSLFKLAGKGIVGTAKLVPKVIRGNIALTKGMLKLGGKAAKGAYNVAKAVVPPIAKLAGKGIVGAAKLVPKIVRGNIALTKGMLKAGGKVAKGAYHAAKAIVPPIAKLAGKGIVGAAKLVPKVIRGNIALTKGILKAGGMAAKGAFHLAKKVIPPLGRLFGDNPIVGDVYVGKEKTPRMRAELIKNGHYFNKKDNSVISSLADVTSEVVDADGNIVLNADEIKTAYVAGGVGKFLRNVIGTSASLLWNTAKFTSKLIPKAIVGAFGLAGKVVNYIGSMRKPFDVYAKSDMSKPLLYAELMKTGKYFNKSTGAVINHPKDIKGEVVDDKGNVVVSTEQLNAGLVDVNSASVGGGLVSKILKAGAHQVVKGFNTLRKLTTEGTKINPDNVVGGIKSYFKDKLSPITDVLSNSNKTVTLLEKIHDVLDLRLPAAKKKIAGDLDGDGDRDGSVEDERQHKAEKKKAEKEKGDKTTKPDDKKAGPTGPSWIDKLKDKVSKLFNKKGDGNEKSLLERGRDLLGDDDDNSDNSSRRRRGRLNRTLRRAKRGLRNIGRKARGLFRPNPDGSEGMVRRGINATKRGASKLMDKIPPKGKRLLRRGKIAGKKLIRGAAKVAKPIAQVAGRGVAAATRGIASAAPGIVRGVGAIGATAMRGVAAAAPAVAAGVGMAGTAIAGVAGAAGTALAAGAGLLSWPVVLGAAAIAGTAYGGYKLYQYLKKTKLDDMSRVRLAQYGFNDKDEDVVKKIFMIEDSFEPYVSIDSSGKISLDHDKVDKKGLLNELGISSKQQMETFHTWYHNRFRPVLASNLIALKAINEKNSTSVKLSNVNGDLAPKDKIELLDKSTANMSAAHNLMASPLPGLLITENDTSVQSAVSLVKIKIDKDLKEDGKAPLSKDVALAGAGAAGVAALTDGPQTSEEMLERYRKNEELYKVVDKDGNEIEGTRADKESAISSGIGKVIATATIPKDLVYRGGDRVDALTSIRFKAYGLTEMEAEKVKQLMKLESVCEKNLTFASGKVSLRGNTDEIMRLAAGDFGVTAPNGLDGRKWKEWFNFRFVAVYLAYVNTMCAIAKVEKPANAKMIITPVDQITIANQIISATGVNSFGAVTSVWKMTTSPWADYVLGSNPDITKGNLEAIKALGKKIVLGEDIRAPKGEEGVKNQERSIGGVIKDAIFGNDKLKEIKQVASAGQGAGVSAAGDVVSTGKTVESSGQKMTIGAGTGGSFDKIPNPQGKGWSAVKDTIIQAGKLTGVDPRLIAMIAGVESGFDPSSLNPRTNAAGLGNFLPKTWGGMRKYFKKYGIPDNTSPMDGRANALMIGELVKENANVVKGATGKELTQVDAYIAHFLGGSGAAKFLKYNTNDIGVEKFPTAAGPNKEIFYKDPKSLSGPRTIGEIYQMFGQKMKGALSKFGIKDSDFEGSTSPESMDAAKTTTPTASSAIEQNKDGSRSVGSMTIGQDGVARSNTGAADATNKTADANTGLLTSGGTSAPNRTADVNTGLLTTGGASAPNRSANAGTGLLTTGAAVTSSTGPTPGPGLNRDNNSKPQTVEVNPGITASQKTGTLNVTIQREESKPHGTFGIMKLPDGTIFHTLELPWKNNARANSCIPAGQYTAKRRQTTKFGMAYEVMAVPGRSGILIHAGTFAGDTNTGMKANSQGCILLGLGRVMNGGQPRLDNPKAAIEALYQKTGFAVLNLTIQPSPGQMNASAASAVSETNAGSSIPSATAALIGPADPNGTSKTPSKSLGTAAANTPNGGSPFGYSSTAGSASNVIRSNATNASQAQSPIQPSNVITKGEPVTNVVRQNQGNVQTLSREYNPNPQEIQANSRNNNVQIVVDGFSSVSKLLTTLVNGQIESNKLLTEINNGKSMSGKDKDKSPVPTVRSSGVDETVLPSPGSAKANPPRVSTPLPNNPIKMDRLV